MSRKVVGALLAMTILGAAKMPPKPRMVKPRKLSLVAGTSMKVAPAAAFWTPAPGSVDWNALQVMKTLNPSYFAGYDAGRLVPIPGPGTYPDYWHYRAAVYQYELPRTNCLFGVHIFCWPNAYNIGVDLAMVDAANWFWIHDPDSCGVLANGPHILSTGVRMVCP